jgi:hypothetical protein
VEKLELFCCAAAIENSVEAPQEPKIELSFDPAMPHFWVYIQMNLKQDVREIFSHSSTL